MLANWTYVQRIISLSLMYYISTSFLEKNASSIPLNWDYHAIYGPPYGWSGRTIYGAVDRPLALYKVPPDHSGSHG